MIIVSGKSWQTYFNYTFVDARKPSFFNEGTVLRRVEKDSGHLSIGKYDGDELDEMAVYSGGNCEVLSKLIGARGKDVLYVGDHIFGDVVKSKKIRGWRTFLIVPELNDELNVWTSKQKLWQEQRPLLHRITVNIFYCLDLLQGVPQNAPIFVGIC